MEGPRAPTELEWPRTLEFLSKQLRPQVNWTIAEEYPLALSEANRENMRIITDADKVLSGAVVKTSLMRCSAGLFKVAGIGSVVTAPEFRQMGLSRSVLESLVQVAQSQACDFAVLWSDLHDFYRKLGFELAGSEITLTIAQELTINLPSGYKIVEGPRVSPDAIARLYSQHTAGAMRTAEDIRRSLLIPNMKVYTLWDERQVLQAYAVEGKGADLTGHIHEWGGSVSKLLPLFAHIRREKKQPITVMTPAHSKNLIRHLKDVGATAHEGVLCMIKLINPDLLFAKIRRHARNLGHEDFVLERRDREFFFGRVGSVFKTDAEADMVRLVFGPTRARDLAEFDAATLTMLEAVLPLPIWIWGWDSV